jgi:hypothetical protein
MALHPDMSLPRQMKSHADLIGTYRLLDNERVCHETLSAPHWESTRQRAGTEPVVLMVQDISQLDYTHYGETMDGLGPIGDGRGKGLLLHSTLAVLPGSREVLGLAHQHVYTRVPVAEGKDRRSRPKAERESRVWGEAVRAIGRPPAGTRWVVVSDRETDHTDFLLTCRGEGHDFDIRLGYASRVILEGNQRKNLRATVQSWAPVVEKRVEVRARGGRAGRQARVLVSFGQVRLQVPKGEAALDVWVVRAWEVEAPEGVDPLEWILATSVRVATAEDALERVEWYTTRWVVEDYHQCLKTGCAIEERDLETADRIQRLLGIMAPVAVRLLQLRDNARAKPDMAASAVADPLMVRVLAAKSGLRPEEMTVRTFCREVAKMGGFLGRRRDGEPGWKTLWRGWTELETLTEGVRIAKSLSLS